MKTRYWDCQKMERRTDIIQKLTFQNSLIMWYSMERKAMGSTSTGNQLTCTAISVKLITMSSEGLKSLKNISIISNKAQISTYPQFICIRPVLTQFPKENRNWIRRLKLGITYLLSLQSKGLIYTICLKLILNCLITRKKST